MFANDSKVLVIDDMSFMRKTVKRFLSQLEFTNISDADDGTTAWDLIEEKRAAGEFFDLIICDWNMPKLKGIELLKMVRSHASPEIANVPFLMLTAETEVVQVKEAIQQRVTGYIAKPFKIETLKDKLEAAHQLILKQKQAA